MKVIKFIQTPFGQKIDSFSDFEGKKFYFEAVPGKVEPFQVVRCDRITQECEVQCLHYPYYRTWLPMVEILLALGYVVVWDTIS